MDMLICNKCYDPIKRGKQPYNIMQCAHVYCQNCLQEAEKQCVQCGLKGTLSLPLKEPLPSDVSPLFMSFIDTFEMLLKVEMFRSIQIQITVKRFLDMDNKYGALKKQYWILHQNMQKLQKLCEDLKAKAIIRENQFSEMQNSRQTSKMRTPANPHIFIHPSSSGYSSESMEMRSSITPINLTKTTYENASSFRIPATKRKIVRSTDMYNRTNMNLNASFRK